MDRRIHYARRASLLGDRGYIINIYKEFLDGVVHYPGFSDSPMWQINITDRDEKEVGKFKIKFRDLRDA